MLSIQQLLAEVLTKNQTRVNSRVVQLIDAGDRPAIVEALRHYTAFLEEHATTSQRCWHLVTNTYAAPTCECGSVLPFVRFSVGYQKYCSLTCATASPERMQKTRKTNLERYGAANVMHVDQFVNQLKATNKERYGVEYPLQNETIRKKAHTTQTESTGNWGFKQSDRLTRANLVKLDKYGTTHSNPASYSHVTDIQRSLLADQDLLTKWHHSDKMTLTEIADTIGVSRSTVIRTFDQHEIPTQLHHQSSHERDITTWLTESGIAYETNIRTLISPYELDVVIPSAKVAIEVNGLWYHSERYGYDKKRHLTKTEMCNKLGYRLLHLYDYELINKRDICYNMIASSVGVNQKVGARKLSIKELPHATYAEFFNTNHIQGAGTPASVCYGLFDGGGDVVAAMSFGAARYAGDVEWELLRYASKGGITVVGGATRLFSHFLHRHSPRSIISYSDRRLFTGTVYEKLGFVWQRNSTPNYWYFDKAPADRLYHRAHFQKHKLAGKLATFDPELTEWDNMKANNWNRVWDCGNQVFLWQPK